ncbi:MAG TPA: PfkB family carbohydrate kinase, partial [Terriglobales bacterium]|nr:PfkB family carbohydrate kinase [Terriglobales bacterium]
FEVLPIARVGDDPAGRGLIQEMNEVGIETSHIQLVAELPTLFSVCFQYPDRTGGNITTSNSAASRLSQTDIEAAINFLRTGASKVIALAMPEVPLEVRRQFLELAKGSGAFCVASFAGAEVRPALESGVFHNVDLVSLNASEAEQLIGLPLSREAADVLVSDCQKLLVDSYPELKVIVTAGKSGAYGITAREWRFCPAPKVGVASTAGAGDALLGGVIAALAGGIPFLGSGRRDDSSNKGLIESALDMGVLLASYKCLSPHTIHPEAAPQSLVEFASRLDWSLSPDVAKLLTPPYPGPGCEKPGEASGEKR